MTRTELLDLDAILGDPRNPKAHDSASLDASLARFGYVEPMVRDDRTGLLVAGHGRLDALRARRQAEQPAPEGVVVEGDRWLVPVLVGWSSVDDTEAAAVLVALNRVSERGGWNDDALVRILDSLGQDRLLGTGFEPADLDAILARMEGREIAYGSATAAGEGSLDDRAANYRHREVRSMVLDYPADEYLTVLALADVARPRLGVVSNAELPALAARGVGC